MKIVKERINEISRGESSGLGSIGIGSAALCEAYIKASKLDPELKDVPPLSDEVWILNDGLRDFKKTMSKIFDVPLEKIILVYKPDLNNEARRYLTDIADKDWFANNKDIILKRLRWASSRETDMSIQVMNKIGLAYVIYDHDGTHKSLFCFRIP